MMTDAPHSSPIRLFWWNWVEIGYSEVGMELAFSLLLYAPPFLGGIWGLGVLVLMLNLATVQNWHIQTTP